MATVLASVVFTVEELASLAQAMQTLQTLASKIQSAAPDAWAAVASDFKSAEQTWNQASVPAPAASGAVYNTDVGHVQAAPAPAPAPVQEPASPPVPPEVQAIVEASGQLPGMPVGSDAAPPAVKPAEESEPLHDSGESFRIDS